MNFDFNENENAIREKVKGLFDTDARVALAQLENGDEILIRSTILHWLEVLGQIGYLALGMGNGKNNIELLRGQESLASISPSLFLSVDTCTRVFGRLVAVYGTPDQRNEFLSPLKEGRLIGAVALSEANMSVENNPLNTTWTSVGNSFQVSGSKSYVVNGPIADWIAIAGMQEESLVFFLIKKDAKGLSIGQKLSTLGFNGTTICTLTLKNCSVSHNYVIGPFENKEPLKTLCLWEDQILTVGSLGLMQRCYNTALQYAKNHKSGGKPIVAYQEVGFKLAEMLTLMQTAQLMAYRTSWMTETENREARVLAHCAKVFCTESAEVVASNALQILGGYGYFQRNLAEEGYRNVKYLQIAGTSTEISRMKIGDGVLEGE